MVPSSPNKEKFIVFIKSFGDTAVSYIQTTERLKMHISTIDPGCHWHATQITPINRALNGK